MKYAKHHRIRIAYLFLSVILCMISCARVDFTAPPGNKCQNAEIQKIKEIFEQDRRRYLSHTKSGDWQEEFYRRHWMFNLGSDIEPDWSCISPNYAGGTIILPIRNSNAYFVLQKEHSMGDEVWTADYPHILIINEDDDPDLQNGSYIIHFLPSVQYHYDFPFDMGLGVSYEDINDSMDFDGVLMITDLSGNIIKCCEFRRYGVPPGGKTLTRSACVLNTLSDDEYTSKWLTISSIMECFHFIKGIGAQGYSTKSYTEASGYVWDPVAHCYRRIGVNGIDYEHEYYPDENDGSGGEDEEFVDTDNLFPDWQTTLSHINYLGINWAGDYASFYDLGYMDEYDIYDGEISASVCYDSVWDPFPNLSSIQEEPEDTGLDDEGGDEDEDPHQDIIDGDPATENDDPDSLNFNINRDLLENMITRNISYADQQNLERLYQDPLFKKILSLINMNRLISVTIDSPSGFRPTQDGGTRPSQHRRGDEFYYTVEIRLKSGAHWFGWMEEFVHALQYSTANGTRLTGDIEFEAKAILGEYLNVHSEIRDCLGEGNRLKSNIDNLDDISNYVHSPGDESLHDKACEAMVRLGYMNIEGLNNYPDSDNFWNLDDIMDTYRMIYGL
ncbi:MAG: hypothetical protein MJY67_03625 [Bacteroidales bacterium]|nr:hypothetical protein [Bacteroidales bacterium]